jgi:hypothetical protein
MASIYASAKFTIIAAGGDADYELRGLLGISAPRIFREHIHYFHCENIIEADFTTGEETSITTEYAKRR